MKVLSVRFAAAVAVLFSIGMLAFAVANETPLGGIKGRVFAQESGMPLEASVYLTGTNQEGDSKTYESYSRNGAFSFAGVPVGDYKLQVRSDWRASPEIKVTIEEGKTSTFAVELAPGPPTLELYVHQHIFTPDERAQVTCKGYIEAGAIGVSIHKVNLDSFLVKSGGNLRRLLGLESYYGDGREYEKLDLTRNPDLTLADSFSQSIAKREAEGNFIQRIDLPRLGPGLYVVAVRGDTTQQIGWIMVTSLGLVTKTAPGETLAYAVDLKSGAPVPGADIKAYIGSNLIASGNAGADGLMTIALPGDGKHSSEQTIVARNGESFAFVSAYMSSTESGGDTIYAYTDRPVYRPGQKVYYKGIARRFVGENYEVMAGKQVTVEVRDPRDTLIYREVRTTDRFGCYHGAIQLNPETATGSYSLTSNLSGNDDENGISFRVAAYVKPEFSAKVTFAKKRYIRGDQAVGRIRAEYYFGAPVANATIDYTVRRAPYWLFIGDDDEEWADFDQEGYEDYGGYGESVADGTVTTDANGEAEIVFDADWPMPEKEDGWDSDQEFSVEAYVSDKSDRGVDCSGSVVVTRGEFAIDVTPDRYVVSPGTKVNVAIQAQDFDRHPIRHKKLTAVIGRDVWRENESTFEKLEERTVTTDGSGRASLDFAVKRSGDIRIVLSADDDKGNRIVGSGWIWSYSEAGDESGARYPDLQIITDKKVYNPGDTARVLINTKKTGATALVTVEGDRIYDRRTVLIKNKSTAVDLPVKAEYKPNFYISVCYVKDKGFAQQTARARVSLDLQTLKVSIKPDRRKYQPADTAGYLIKATDSRGKPVSAELSIGVVDEAIYAIERDRTPKMLGFFYSRKGNRVNTNFSFPEIYLSDPDKATAAAKMAGPDVRIRKRFEDTAFWMPDVITDSKGEARVRFQLPDNLTTWRATVRGVTMDTVVGEATNKVIVQQPLMVRLQTPRFLVQGDSSILSAIVHNYTGTDRRVKVSIRAPGVKLTGSRSQDVLVADGGSERIDWTVNAGKPGSFPVTVTAVGGKATDGMQLTLPVYPHGERRDITRTDAIRGTNATAMNLSVRQDSIPESTKLVVRFAPSLASAMLGSLQYLAQYPYGCTEQTTSSFLPDVILARSLRSLGVNNAKLESELPDMVNKGLFRLYRFQLEDGGWGWCEYGDADAWMTAYVCYGLVQARTAGFTVNDDILGHGLGRLAKMLANPKLDLDTKAYGYYVLALAGVGQDTGANLAGIAQSGVSSKSLAAAALGLAQLGQAEQAAGALSKLLSRASVDSGFIHWSGDREGYYSGGGTDVETTALALQAMLRISPSDPRITGVVQWLMKQRNDNYWYSTRDTAMTLYAMSEYLAISKELTPDYTADLIVNGRSVSRLHFTKPDVFNPDREIVVDSRDLRKGRNEIRIAKVGAGNLYYSVRLTQYIAKDPIPATITGAGVSVTRAYFVPGSRYEETGDERHLGRPVTGCDSGETVLVRLTINSSKQMEHLLLEDFYPAGCEVIDKGHLDYYDWDYWWVGRDIRDERISFYLDNLSPGKHVITYRMRATIPGEYHAMPAQIFDMYNPKVRATTEETGFTVR